MALLRNDGNLWMILNEKDLYPQGHNAIVYGTHLPAKLVIPFPCTTIYRLGTTRESSPIARCKLNSFNPHVMVIGRELNLSCSRVFRVVVIGILLSSFQNDVI